MNNPLFAFGDDWKNNACINRTFSPIFLYIQGYKEAGDVLAKNVIEGGSSQDVLVYPIAFLYRQYIELQLKALVGEANMLLSGKTAAPKHHKIKALWEEASGLMKQIIKTIDKSVASYITADDFAAIGAVIGHFAEVDPDSISFRYPQDKLGRNTMEGLTHINIRALAEKIGDLAARLEKFVLVAGQLNAWQCDMNATFGP